MMGSKFIFDCLNLWNYKYQTINPNHGGSYIDSPDSIKVKKATINPINYDDKCFQYAAMVALNHTELGKNS